MVRKVRLIGVEIILPAGDSRKGLYFFPGSEFTPPDVRIWGTPVLPWFYSDFRVYVYTPHLDPSPSHLPVFAI
jgi:hypothetical protein